MKDIEKYVITAEEAEEKDGYIVFTTEEDAEAAGEKSNYDLTDGFYADLEAAKTRADAISDTIRYHVTKYRDYLAGTFDYLEYPKIINYAETKEALTTILMDLDKACRTFQTDVYMYLSSTGHAKLDTFSNPGGNSWLDDEHYTIYEDGEHFERYNGCFANTTPEMFAEIIGISLEQLEQEIRAVYQEKFAFFDADAELDSTDVYDYLVGLDAPEAYQEKLRAQMAADIDAMRENYEDYADRLLQEWTEKVRETYMY